jgi:hypothetical protein
MTVLQILLIGMGAICVALPAIVQRAFLRSNKDMPFSNWYEGRSARIGFRVLGVVMLLLAVFLPHGGAPAG